MSIYIHRNNQQTGPFEEHAVLAWLRGGQLSGEDLACRAGENKWRPLKTLFPMTNNVQPAQPAAQVQPYPPSRDESPQNKKGGGAKILLFVLLGVGGMLLFGVAVVENGVTGRAEVKGFDAYKKDGYVVLMPFQEIEDYLKTLPTS